MSLNDAPGQESPGPADGSSQKEIAVKTDSEQGVGTASVPTESDAWATVKLEELVSEDAVLSVTGYWYDDEEPQVEVTVGVSVGTIVLNLTPERARVVAEDLREVAEHAEHGDKQLD